MKKLSLLFVLLIILACQSNQESNPSDNGDENCVGYYSNLNICRWNQECLPIDSVFVGNNVPLITDTSTLFGVLGRPKRIIPIITSRNNSMLLKRKVKVKGNYLIFGNTIFEQYGQDVIVNTFDFESTDIALSSPKITLKKDLEPKVVQKVFPESGRLIGWTSGNVPSCKIVVSTKRPHGGLYEAWWFFVFQTGQLKRIVLYSTPEVEEVFPDN